MKYKTGDTVKIKTWKEMEREYGLDRYGNIRCKERFTHGMEKEINRDFSNRILTIEKISINTYKIKNINWYWSDDMIKCLVKDYKEKIFKPILSRFEILDIR